MTQATSDDLATWTERKRSTWLLAVAVGIPLLLVLSQATFLWDFSIDDVGISWRYAQHLADGHGLTWNIDGPPVEGYSNFLWVLMIAVPGAFGMDIELASKILGVLCASASIILFALVLRRLFPESRFWWAPLWVVALLPEWTLWSVSGLELALFGFFPLLALYGLMNSGRRRTVLAVAMAGLVLTRPEGFAVAIVMIMAIVALDRGSEWKVRWENIRVPAITLVATLVLLVAFRLWYFGYPLPNTVYAKFSPTLPAARQVGDWLLVLAPFVTAWVFVTGWGDRRRLIRGLALQDARRKMLAVAIITAVAHTFMTMPVVPVMNFLHRYHVSLLPFWLLAFPLALDAMARRRVAVAIFASAVFMLWSARGWPAVLERVEIEAYLKNVQRCVVSALRELPGTPTIAIIDAGRIPYWTDLPTIDVWGLCDVDIAHEASPPVSVMKRAPAVYITTVDSLIYGFERPRLGIDVLMYRSGNFAQVYSLWHPCVGKNRPGPAHDYAILVLNRWARDNGVRIPDRREFWDLTPE
jgi:hypothetical protein